MTDTSPSASDDRLIVFTRFPEVGANKSRLISAVGPELATAIHSTLAEQTLLCARQFSTASGVRVEVHFAGGDAASMQDWLGGEWKFRSQSGGTLGERLHHAVTDRLQASSRAQRVVIIGTDCPELSNEQLKSAFDELDRTDVVFGPALDGGYYLIGFRNFRPELFRDIDWGTERVLAQTIDRCRSQGLSVHQLIPLADVDYPEDLLILRRLGGRFQKDLPNVVPGRISFVIPTVNECDHIRQTLERIAKVAAEQAEIAIEMIVVDGRSADDTLAIARSFASLDSPSVPIRVIETRRGRGRQMNAGAALASGEYVMFLHADTKIPADAFQVIRSVLVDDKNIGAFRLAIDGPGFPHRLIEWGANVRSQFLGLPYGDQGLFLRSNDFFQSTGFRIWPLMEDYEFVRRLLRRGKLALSSSRVTTSDRRWRRRGILRTWLTNQLCLIGYHLGVPVERLAQWYRS